MSDKRICQICDGGPGNDCACSCGYQKWEANVSENKQDGGPAFPAKWTTPGILGLYEADSCGMSLRDWLAGQALVGMGMWIPPQGGSALIGGPVDQPDLQRLRAEWAYGQADAMLAARAKS